MSNLKAATLFSGGGGADIGMHDAGIDVRWGIEYDDAIAQVARNNDLRTRTADVTEVDPQALESVDCLHASPPCPSFSTAKTGAKETEHDIELAPCTANIIRAVQPRFFTLENVWGYRKSASWAHIRSTLNKLGYGWNAWHLNAADYGVPQTRKRMIVCAVQGAPPSRPQPTHSKPEAINTTDLFGFTPQPWVGWFEAVDDLISELETTELAPWQKKRLPDELKETTMVGAGGYENDVVSRSQGPAFTITANTNQSTQLRAITTRRVVQLTPRCLARFQTFPDWYDLPERKALACRIIGNAVPPLLMQRVVEHLLH